MTGTDFPLTADDGPDDLPRTLRRAREERDQAQREAAAQSARTPAAPSFAKEVVAPISANGLSSDAHNYDADSNETTVTRLDIPFRHLSGFFLKAVIAAIPALILLIAILWGIGQVLEVLFPELIKMKIQIYFPH